MIMRFKWVFSGAAKFLCQCLSLSKHHWVSRIHNFITLSFYLSQVLNDFTFIVQPSSVLLMLYHAWLRLSFAIDRCFLIYKSFPNSFHIWEERLLYVSLFYLISKWFSFISEIFRLPLKLSSRWIYQCPKVRLGAIQRLRIRWYDPFSSFKFSLILIPWIPILIWILS